MRDLRSCHAATLKVLRFRFVWCTQRKKKHILYNVRCFNALSARIREMVTFMSVVRSPMCVAFCWLIG